MKIYKKVFPVALMEVIKYTCDYFEVLEEDLRGKSRDREFAQPRHFSRYLSKKYLGEYYSLAEIGSITKCDHATVLHSVREVNKALYSEGSREGTWGYKFKKSEEQFVDLHLQDVLRKTSGKLVKRGSRKNYKKLVRHQEASLKFKDRVIANMYMEFLTLSKELEDYVNKDQLVQEGYLKHRAVNLIREKKKTLRKIKMQS